MNRIVIDGQDPDTGVIHTYTEYNSTNYANTIFINNAITKNVTLRNMTITGNNYYDTVCVYQSYSGVTLSYENINYTGPQITFNPAGTASYIDSTILLKLSTGTASQEATEANQVILGGNTTITNDSSTSYPIFNLTNSGASITVLTGANVSITSTNYLVLAPTSGTSFEVQDDASFSLVAPNGMTQSGTSYPITDLTVGKMQRYSQLTQAIVPVLVCLLKVVCL